MPRRPPPEDSLPDVRDGLTRAQRVVLVTLREAQAARGGRPVPTSELYGRVVERLVMTPETLQRILGELGAGPRAGGISLEA